MKKKKLSLNKKLTLNKEAVSILNAGQQEALAGGIPAMSYRMSCITWNTCRDVPSGRMD